MRLARILKPPRGAEAPEAPLTAASSSTKMRCVLACSCVALVGSLVALMVVLLRVSALEAAWSPPLTSSASEATVKNVAAAIKISKDTKSAGVRNHESTRNPLTWTKTPTKGDDADGPSAFRVAGVFACTSGRGDAAADHRRGAGYPSIQAQVPNVQSSAARTARSMSQWAAERATADGAMTMEEWTRSKASQPPKPTFARQDSVWRTQTAFHAGGDAGSAHPL